MSGQKKLTDHDASLVFALIAERQKIDDEIERLRVLRSHLTSAKIAEKMEVSTHLIAMMSCGKRRVTDDETRVRNRNDRRRYRAKAAA